VPTRITSRCQQRNPGLRRASPGPRSASRSGCGMVYHLVRAMSAKPSRAQRRRRKRVLWQSIGLVGFLRDRLRVSDACRLPRERRRRRIRHRLFPLTPCFFACETKTRTARERVNVSAEKRRPAPTLPSRATSSRTPATLRDRARAPAHRRLDQFLCGCVCGASRS